MEDVGLLEIVELCPTADEGACREPPASQHLEEWPPWNEPRHRDHLPTGQGTQPLVHPLEFRYPFGADAERLEAVQKFLAHMALQRLLLAFEQHAPDGVLLGGVALPALVDDAVFNRLRGQNAMSGHRFHSRAPVESQSAANACRTSFCVFTQ